MTRTSLLVLSLAALAFTWSCGSDDKEPEPQNKNKPCDLVAQTGCKTGLVCESVSGGTTACFAPVNVNGKVFDTVSLAAVEGAHVVARDANDVAVSGVAISAKDGTYSLRVPAPRDANGTPVKTDYTLRADAQGYLSFPLAPRVALPVDISTATGDPLTVQSSATDIGLIPLENATGLGQVSGTVLTTNPGGTLVVAGGSTATADSSGVYTVFNVPAGSVSVSGYLAGVNLVPATADVKAGENTPGVDLAEAGAATATVSGTIQIVNATAKSTSIILVVEDTFVANAARGEAPPGLRAANVSGAWSIPAVPDGKYVVLGAFENDNLVRDPDTNIGGTEIQHITVAGANVSVPGFKVTQALAVFSPDGGQEVSGTPTFSFEDDSSEDSYTVEVFDALGNQTWKQEGIVGPKGNKPVDVQYGGPALTAGMYYQFRATSIKAGVPISRTEDLKGVFLYK